MKRASVVVVVFVAVTVAVLWAGPASAQRANHAPGAVKPRPLTHPNVFAAASAAHARPMSPQQREEWRFLKAAAAASRFEREASRLALGKSRDAGVRSFAAMLIEHHASAGIALEHFLYGRGMAPPMLADDQRKILNRLARLNGTKFDREYMVEVGLRYQQEDLRLYESAALAMIDPALQAWVTRKLPSLRNHLAAAQRLTAPSDTRLAKGASVRPVRAARTVAGKPIASSNR